MNIQILLNQTNVLLARVHPVFWQTDDGLAPAYLDLLEGLRGLGGRCLDGPGSSTTGVCDVERREDLEGRGIVFVLINLKRGRGRTSVNTLSGGYTASHCQR